MESVTAAKKILVAIRPEDLAVTENALGPGFNTAICHSLPEAMCNLNVDVAVILCGLRFDGGLIFDLLRFAKHNSETRSIPFYPFVESSNLFPAGILASIEMAARVLGADGLLHLTDVTTGTAAQPDPTENLRQIIRNLL